jgi:hypothetical protein
VSRISKASGKQRYTVFRPVQNPFGNGIAAVCVGCETCKNERSQTTMLLQARCGRTGRRRSMPPCVLAMVLFVACDRAAPTRGDQRGVMPEALKIDDVQINAVDSGLIFQYRTRTSSGDCKAQAVEMPKVWDQVVKARLTDSRLQRVFLVPHDPSGQSVSLAFTKSASRWSSAAPCSITIPAG